MASGFVVVGRGDLDDLFMLRVNAARANVGFRLNDVDIAQRYEPIGTGTPIAALGMYSVPGGGDLASLFRDKNQPLITNTMGAAYSSTHGQTGYGTTAPAYGSMTPTTYAGIAINQFADSVSTGRFTFALQNPSLAVNFWSTITVNGRTFVSGQQLSFGHTANITYWVFSTGAGFANGGNYPILIQ